MLPKSNETPRGRYLQDILEKAAATDLVGWPMLIKDDFVLVGALVILFSYIDLNLRRILEVYNHAGLLADPWKKNVGNLRGDQVADAIQSLACWDKSARKALLDLEEIRGARNLLAHFAIRRFPDEDAFVCIAKSARDFKKQFGRDAELGEMLTAVIDREQLVGIVSYVERVQNWLSAATPDIENQLAPRDGKEIKAAPGNPVT